MIFFSRIEQNNFQKGVNLIVLKMVSEKYLVSNRISLMAKNDCGDKIKKLLMIFFIQKETEQFS